MLPSLYYYLVKSQAIALDPSLVLARFLPQSDFIFGAWCIACIDDNVIDRGWYKFRIEISRLPPQAGQGVMDAAVG